MNTRFRTKRHVALLEQGDELSDHPAQGIKRSGGKAKQEGMRVKLTRGTTWDLLSKLNPEQIKERSHFTAAFEPLPHPNHPVGGMLFPQFEIDEIKKQEGRDVTRVDLDFDIPEHRLPEFPPPIYLTTRADLGDVSHGALITTDNDYEFFNGILNPKQLGGLRLLLTTFPQQQSNFTEDRRSERPSPGDVRPQEFRHRINTPSLRGLSIQRSPGSQRALKTIEDLTEFEQRAAHFDGDPVIAQRKGVNTLDRGSRVHAKAEFQALLDFPPAPKLGVDGKFDPKKADAAEMCCQQLFFGKARCVECSQAPSFNSHLVNGMMAYDNGPIKTFPLRGASVGTIRESQSGGCSARVIAKVKRHV